MSLIALSISNATLNCFYFYFKLQTSPNRHWAVVFFFFFSRWKVAWLRRFGLCMSQVHQKYEKKASVEVLALKKIGIASHLSVVTHPPRF